MAKTEKQPKPGHRKLVRNTVRVFMAVIGLLVGPGLLAIAASFLKQGNLWDFNTLTWWLRLICYGVLSAVTCLLFVMATPGLLRFMERVERRLQTMPVADMISGVVGFVIGLFIAFLLSQLAAMIPFGWLALPLSILLYVALGYLGLTIGIRRREELAALLNLRGKSQAKKSRSAEGEDEAPSPKILDTSVIIDGRIFDIAKTGFLEGSVWVPRFVLTELRHIADSPDLLKRNRGRRGLDVLSQMQKELPFKVVVPDTDYDDVSDVDQKLLRLARETGGMVVTNDFNLNKVAGVQGVRVLNINELSNAVKPVALPGEDMTINLVREGKETGQGVGFLPDGTMVVVENGSRMLGMMVDIVVTSSLQTSAGRMVFGKLKED